MPSLKWIQHKGRRILYTDIASQTTEELLDIVERTKKEFANEPLNSVLCLCNVTGGKTNTEINQAVKGLVKFIDPYSNKVAVIGLEGLQKILFNSVMMFTKSKKVITKNSREEALDYLAE